MTESEKPKFFRVMLALAETWKEPMSDLRLEGYWMGLCDLTIADLEAAALKAIRGCTYFPRPAELREMVHGNPERNVELAWMTWKNAARRFGGGASIVIEDAALADTLTQMFGGWPEACAKELSPEMWASVRKEFDRVYGTMLERGARGMRYLVGSHERNNSSRSDWQRFTPVGLISGATLKQLSGEQAERFRLKAAESRMLGE
jgi:hypothetical protein